MDQASGSDEGMSFHAGEREYDFILWLLISDKRVGQVVSWKPREACKLFRAAPSHPSMDVGLLSQLCCLGFFALGERWDGRHGAAMENQMQLGPLVWVHSVPNGDFMRFNQVSLAIAAFQKAQI